MNTLRITALTDAHRRFATAALALILSCVCITSYAAVRAYFGSATAQVGDTLTLVIQSDSAQTRARPDLGPLAKDFDVLGTSTSSETTLINGSSSQSTRWIVQLQPRHAGTISVAPIAVGNELTNALTLRVTPASPQAAAQTSAHVFIEVDAAKAHQPLYVQQQIPYTVRLYYDDSVQNGDLTAPASDDVIVEQLGKEDRYSTMRDGREYNVVVRRYALTPEKSGELHIAAASFRGDVLVATRQQGGSFPGDDLMRRMLRGTPFANSPMFKNPMFQGGGFSFGSVPRPVVVRGRDLRLEVKPRPASAQAGWLPAEQVSLHDSWTDKPPQFKVGEPVTRTITIEAQGLTATQIPKLAFAQPRNARVYPEASHNQSRSDGDELYGVSKQSVTYIPSAQGKLNIAPIELQWWNTRTDTQSHAELPAWQFQVASGAAQAQSNAPPPTARAATPLNRAAQPATTTGSSTAQASAATAWTASLHRNWIWFALAAVSVLAIAAAAVLFQRRRRNSASVATPAPVLPERKSTLQALHDACTRNDGHAAARALLELARIEWPDDPPRGLGALAARLEAGADEVSALDRGLYGAGGTPWEGDALWNAVGQGLRHKRGERGPEDDNLAALYG